MRKGNKMTYTFADELISDLHKDAHGMRPTSSFMDAWMFDSDEGKQATWDYLVMVMKESMEQEKNAEAQALLVFKDKLRSIMADCGYNWKQALRSWTDEVGAYHGLHFFLYDQGLSKAKADEIVGCFQERITA